MASSGSKAAIILAIGGNALVTVTKGIAWVVSGSGSMFSETMHSLADTMNQGLLLIGHQRAQAPPTERHPYGFGPEASFWGLLAAIGILVLGGGLSLIHGIESLGHPKVPTDLPLVFGVLAIAVVVEGFILVAVFKGLAKTRGDLSWRAHLANQGPGVITVILEDAAAMLGAILAGIALGMCELTQDGIYDAIGQLVIGVMLTVIAVILIYRHHGFLIGKGLSSAKVKHIRIFMEDLEGIERVTDLKTRQLSCDAFTVKAEVVFSGGFLAGKIIPEYAESFSQESDEEKTSALLGRYSDRLMEVQAEHVDRLERLIQARFPGAVNIDLEPHLRDI